MCKALLLSALVVLVALVEINGSPLSIWEEHLLSRVRRGEETPSADVLPTDSTSTVSARQRRESKADAKDCPEDLLKSCKEDSCPMDDQSIAQCCKCYEKCCSSESGSKEQGSDSTSEPEPETSPESDSTMKNMTDSAKTAMNETAKDMKNMTESAKNSLNETAQNMKGKAEDAANKVEGFFKNVGQSIKQGVGTAMDKVKSTATDIKESARKGVNQAADWVKNKTGMGEDGSKSSASCTEGKSVKGAISTTPTNFKDAANCTVEEISNKGDEMTGTGGDESSAESSLENSSWSSKSKRSLDDNMNMSTMSSSTETVTSTPDKVQGMRKSKRSPVDDSESEFQDMSGTSTIASDSNSRNRRGADDSTTEPNTEGTTNDSTTESSEEETTDKPGKEKASVIIHISGGERGSRNDTPIRAPGSVDPREATYSKNSTGRVSINLSSGDGLGGIGQGQSLSSSGSSGTAGSSSSSSNQFYMSGNSGSVKPGLCRPLSQGLQCIALGKEAAQCSYDSMCSDNKKCCFYSCSQNAAVGVCEHPIFY